MSPLFLLLLCFLKTTVFRGEYVKIHFISRYSLCARMIEICIIVHSYLFLPLSSYRSRRIYVYITAVIFLIHEINLEISRFWNYSIFLFKLISNYTNITPIQLGTASRCTTPSENKPNFPLKSYKKPQQTDGPSVNCLVGYDDQYSSIAASSDIQQRAAERRLMMS